MIIKDLYGYHFAINMDFKKKMLDQWKKQKIAGAIYLDGLTEEEAGKMDFSEAEYLMLTTNVRHYHITQPVLELSQKIKIKDEKNYKWLLSIPDQTSQYTFQDTFFIFQKKGDRIAALASTKFQHSFEQDYIHWDMFNININVAELNIHRGSEYAMASYKLLLQLLTFIELSEIEEITIKPNSQHGFGSKKDPNTYYNANKFPITVVNSRWTQKVYRPGEFWVGDETGGFLRVQPYGPGRSQYRLIWIEPFKKKGITISAGKERKE